MGKLCQMGRVSSNEFEIRLCVIPLKRKADCRLDWLICHANYMDIGTSPHDQLYEPGKLCYFIKLLGKFFTPEYLHKAMSLIMVAVIGSCCYSV